jgi:MFS family permease
MERLTLLRPLALRDFRLVWLGQAVSMLGDQFHMIALAWLVLDLTGSGLALGTVLMASSIPRAILIVVGGALADRIPPRRLILGSDIARGLTVGALAALALSGRAELWHLAAMGIVFGIADALFFPAMNAIVPQVVDTDRLPAANGLVQSTAQLTTLVGPVVAGLLVVAVGSGAAFAVDAVSFAIAALAILAVRGAHHLPSRPTAALSSDTGDVAPETKPALLADIKAGARYAAADPAIRTLLVLSAAFNLAINGPIAVGLPWLADQRFAADASVFGLMLAGFGLGALIGALVAGSLHQAPKQGTLLLTIASSLGIGMAAIGFAPAPLVVLLILAAMGLGIGYLNVVVIAWLQAHVEPSMIGRVMGLAMLASFGLGPVSLAVAGILVDWSATVLFVGAGLLIFVVSLIGLASGARHAIDLSPTTPNLEGGPA